MSKEEQRKLVSELRDKANRAHQQIKNGEKQQDNHIIITEEMINQGAKDWGVTFEESVKLWSGNIDEVVLAHLNGTIKPKQR